MVNIYKFIGKKDKTYDIDMKLNYNCPKDQKNGEGPGSCKGTSELDAETYAKTGKYPEKSTIESSSGRNRFVVTSPDGKKYAFRDKDFAKLAADRLDNNKPIDDIIKRHDDLYKKIGLPTQRTNPETGLPVMMKGGYEMEFDNNVWKRTKRDIRKV